MWNCNKSKRVPWFKQWFYSSFIFFHSIPWQKILIQVNKIFSRGAISKCQILNTNQISGPIFPNYAMYRQTQIFTKVIIIQKLNINLFSLIFETIYSTALNCKEKMRRGRNYMWRLFLKFLKWGGQNKMPLSNFRNIALNGVPLIEWGKIYFLKTFEIIPP